MRRLFTTHDLALTRSALRWGEERGRWRQIRRGVYADGPEHPTALDDARAVVLARHGVASNGLAGVLLGLDGVDGVSLAGPPMRRRVLPPDRVTIVGGIPCTSGVQTLADLAAVLDDATWEQALESALRKRLATLAQVEEILAEMSAVRARGASRVRRVLGIRTPGAPPTGSLLETLMVQLARSVPEVPELVRQCEVYDEHGLFVARLDLADPGIGVFFELDGQQHKDQPVYDARRETAVVAATGWLPGRFTWTEVVRLPNTTRRRLAALCQQARRRTTAPERS